MMKKQRNLISALCVICMFALTVTMLSGCGNNAQSVSSNNNTSQSKSKNKKAKTLSEHLSKEKTIGYVVSKMDKEAIPSKIYFFEKGKVTIIPGEEFEMTLGDFSQMKEKEIWKKYESVKETYKEKYVVEREKSIDLWIESEVERILDEALEQETQGRVSSASQLNAFLSAKDNADWDSLLGLSMMYLKAIGQPDEEVRAIVGIVENAIWSGTVPESDVFDKAISYYQNILDNVQSKKDEFNSAEFRNQYASKGPFFDIPFSFAVKTDSSGNYVLEEWLLHPTLENPIGSIPTSFYDKSFNFETSGSAGEDEIKIYDTTYLCFDGKGNSIFCTRDIMQLDDVNSKNVLIDPTENELNELFKEEVTERYK